MKTKNCLAGISVRSLFSLLIHIVARPGLLLVLGLATAAEGFALEIKSAEYDTGKSQLKVEVSLNSRARRTVDLYDLDTNALLDSKSTRGAEVRFRVGGLSGSDVPCTVRAESDGDSDTRSVAGAPSNCGGEPPPPPPENQPPTCAIVQPASDLTGSAAIGVGDSTYFEGYGEDPEGGSVHFDWDFNGGADVPRTDPVPGDVTFDVAGMFIVHLTVTDDANLPCHDEVAVEVGTPPIGLPPKVSEQPAPGTRSAGDGDHVVLAFNDLGMHCADLGSWPFSILPLFNTVNSQVVRRGTQGSDRPRLLDDGSIGLRYSAASNPLDPVGPGSINSTSQNYPPGWDAATATVRKTDFWDIFDDDGHTIVNLLFGGLLDPVPDEGLQTLANPDHGRYMPGIGAPYDANEPQEFSGYDATHEWFTAQGIPITSVDDQGRLNSYPLMRVQAVDNGSGQVLATTDAVVPVSTEVDCRDCHGLGEIAADPDARGPGGPEFVAALSADRVDAEAAAKHNILVLHDFKHGTHFVTDGRPVLCAGCHRSNALAEVGGPGGTSGLISMSFAMHGFHGRLQVDDMDRLLRTLDGEPDLIDPANMDGSERPLIATGPGIPMEQNCFSCHPGKITQCFRGAMFTAGQTCDDCHGDMLAIGGEFELAGGGVREPWADEPKCSSCHTGRGDNPVGDLAFDPDDPAATPIELADSRFAENPGTLYRNSLDDHAGVACEGCHGSPHAIWPNRNPSANDNVTAMQLQGHAGSIRECTVCHEPGSFPNGTLNGPHGMHPVNDPDWIKSKGDFYHEDFVWSNGEDRCAACHGSDHRGTRLSRVAVDRVLRDADGVVRATVSAGDVISCDLCHSLEKSFSD